MNKTMDWLGETNYHMRYIKDLAILGVANLAEHRLSGLSVMSLGDKDQ